MDDRKYSGDYRMSFTYRENQNTPMTWPQLDGNFREVEKVQVEVSNQALAAAASAETATQASESANLSSGQAEDYASLAEEMARISVVRWCGNHETAPTTRLDGSPLQISDEYGNLTDNLRYNWTGTSWVALNSSAQQLEARLSSDTGAELVKLDGRTVADSIADMVNIKDGKYGAIGDGVYRPVSDWYLFGSAVYRGYADFAEVQANYPFVTSPTQSIDWAATQKAVMTGERCYAPAGKYMVSDTILIRIADHLEGASVDTWNVAGVIDYIGTERGTSFVGCGTGAKIHTLKHVSRGDVSGGVLTNPSAAAAHYALAPTPEYSLNDYTNRDAVGATTATPKAFSTIFKTEYIGTGGVSTGRGHSGNCVLKNFRIIPEFDGMSGYTNMNTVALGANWDHGIWLENSNHVHMENVQVVGHYRKIGMLKSNVNEVGRTGRVNSEGDIFMKCDFQGHTGWAVRGIDIYPVVALDKVAKTISIEWSASHTFPPTGSLYNRGFTFNYSLITFETIGGKPALTFAVDPSQNMTTFAVTDSIRWGGGTNGVSGTHFINCRTGGFNHASRVVSTSLDFAGEFDGPGKCFEISGALGRAVKWSFCTFFTREDIIGFLGNAQQPSAIDNFYESASGSASLGGPVMPSGARMIGLSGLMAVTESNAVGNLYTAVDMRPASPEVSATAPARFSVAGDLGLWTPKSHKDDYFSDPFTEGGTKVIASLSDTYLKPKSGVVRVGGWGLANIYLHASAQSMNIGSGLRTRIVTGEPGSETIQYVADAAGIVPAAAGKNLGSQFAAGTFARSYISRRYWNATVWDGIGPESPEGVETAGIGSTFRSTTTGKTWHKETGAGNTGWVVGA